MRIVRAHTREEGVCRAQMEPSTEGVAGGPGGIRARVTYKPSRTTADERDVQRVSEVSAARSAGPREETARAQRAFRAQGATTSRRPGLCSAPSTPARPGTVRAAA
jgi:hypothetical protein